MKLRRIGNLSAHIHRKTHKFIPEIQLIVDKIALQTKALSFLQGGGEMGALTRSHDWSKTSLGPPDQWPQSLRTTLSILLNSKFPMFLFWGPEHICFYNDAYRPSLGNNGKHPHSLGKPGAEVWPEIWSFIGPMIYQVLAGGDATWFEDQFLPIYRNGKMEDVYWTFSYSAVSDETGQPAGVFVTCTETTEKVINAQHLAESRDRLEFALDSGHLGWWELDLKTFTLAASDHCKANFGQPLDQPFAYETLRDCIHPDDRQRQEEEVAGVIATGSEYDIEYRVIWPNGTLRWINVRGQLRFNEKNEPISMVGISLDITDRKLAHETIEESERSLRNIIAQAPFAICIFRGPKFIIEVANRHMTELWGHPAEEVLNRPQFEAVPEAAGQGFEELLTDVLTKGISFRANEQPAQLTRNGVVQPVYVNFVFEPIREVNGTISRIVATALDVTEQVLARQRLQSSESNLRSIIATAPAGISQFTGPDLVIQNPNQTFIDITGKGWDIEGRPLREIYPELASRENSFIRTLQEVYKNGTAFRSYGSQLDIRKDDATDDSYYNLSYTPLLDEEGKVYSILGMAVDVTVQIKAQQKVEEAEVALRNAIDLAELASWSLDIKTSTFHYSPRFMEWLGFSEETKAMDAAYNPLPDEYREQVAGAITAVIQKGSNGLYENEHPVINRLTGKQRIIHAKAQVYYDSYGEPLLLIGTAIDVTEERERQQELELQVHERTKELADANAALQEINKELNRSNQHLEEFAHAASHDLKEPIRKVQVFTEQLKTKLSAHFADGEERLLNRIENASQRMGMLVDDLLLYSHVSQRPHLKEPVDLNESLKRVLEDLELDIQEKSAEIDVETLPVVEGYKRQLQQILQNLISNALKYSKAGVPPQIYVSATRVEERGKPYDCISVKDNGIGFEEEYADKIFNMFTRLHGKHEYAGTGIGLSIVKKVVENHDGFIRAASTLGQGSDFKIYLPVL